ncbi:MAG: response regulator [Nitrospirae bacterium]|nr:response regulator [Nitrospirota bacterium]MBI3350952.1 response regulator [Nitrospirota bacterium]
MTTCVKCKETIELSENIKNITDEVICPKCHARFKVKWKMDLELVPEMELAPVQEKTPSKKILVAVDGEATQEVMREVLTREGFEVFLAGTGKEALSILEKERPEVAYLDVALPQVLGFEICEIIKESSQLKGTKVILVSSIYDKTRYKREPKSLYGADDYIERHHIQDLLIPKLNQLFQTENVIVAPTVPSGPPVFEEEQTDNLPVTGEAQPEEACQPAAVIEPVQEEELSFLEGANEFLLEDAREEEPVSQEVPLESPAETSPLSSEEKVQHEEAKRLARIIISDIALYNQTAIEEGIESGNVEELLKNEIQEAEKLYQERIPREIREGTSYLHEALHDLVERKKKFMKQQK